MGCSDVQLLQEDPTVAQIRNYNDEAIKRSKVRTCFHSIVSDAVFTRIMACEQLKKLGTLSKRRFKGMKEIDRCKFSISEENLRC